MCVDNQPQMIMLLHYVKKKLRFFTHIKLPGMVVQKKNPQYTKQGLPLYCTVKEP